MSWEGTLQSATVHCHKDIINITGEWDRIYCGIVYEQTSGVPYAQYKVQVKQVVKNTRDIHMVQQ